MPARKRLNVAALNGACFLAGGLGLLAQSSLVFWVALGILIAGAVYGGDIRLASTQRSGKPPQS